MLFRGDYAAQSRHDTSVVAAWHINAITGNSRNDLEIVAVRCEFTN
jgi:hypothetical protein